MTNYKIARKQILDELFNDTIEDCLRGKRLSVNTIANKFGNELTRGMIHKLCDKHPGIKRVKPLDVGWGAHIAHSKIFELA